MGQGLNRKAVSYLNDLTVLSMSVMGFQKSLDGEWVDGVSTIHFFLYYQKMSFYG